MGELTRIYSCGDSMTTEQLIDMTNDDHVNSDEFAVVGVWFPETKFLNGTYIPLREPEILARIPDLKGKTIVTVSETLILGFLREIRLGRMRTDELELWCGDRKIAIGTSGDMIDMWDGGWEVSFNLRFH